ncbi:MAG: SH3 domain-containing protein [Candidatus Sericytochromatia bacterium]
MKMKLPVKAVALLLPVLLTCWPIQSAAQAASCPPVDEGLQDLDFVRFRTQLLQILGRRDLKALLKHVDPRIKASFGGHDGHQGLIALWKLDTRPEASGIWQELSLVLSLGGRFDGENPNRFTAPYTFNCPAVNDAFEELIVLGRDVVLRAGPDPKSQARRTLSFELVTRVRDADGEYVESKPMSLGGESHPWFQVRLADGTSGYIWGKYLRSPIDFRAGFTRKVGVWTLDFFVAGD